ncbi:hypothetical protein JIG36_12025 [Actinoplanes sp. LDG1-06]|uniref:Oxidoreductase n=1 Tax=Paractinoplanes ovalisporus TaxID=2810368 RepID=A0ABS2A8Y2_9ACTN|nr:hypothetical protein [Actinoplanes ovalisporus]MBM2616285.1 hypothetical protein [Actinoplanes ovalisporus]
MADESLLEQRLIEAVTLGEPLNLAGDSPVDADSMKAWDARRTVRARVLRDIVRGVLAPQPDSHRLRLHGVRIDGRLDLENLTSDLELELTNCYLPDGLLLRDATLFGLTLDRCLIGQPPGSDDTPVDAERLAARLLRLRRATVRAHNADGAVNLCDAHITGEFSGVGAHLENRSGPALNADRLRVGGEMILTGGFVALGAGDSGAVRLTEAHIGGQLIGNGAHLENTSGPALTADGLTVDQDLFLEDGFEAAGAGDAVLVLADVRVGGRLQLDLSDVNRARSGDPGPVDLDGLTYTGIPDVRPDWESLLHDRTSTYAAQPYQQLARAYRAAGDDRRCRRVLIAQRDDRVHRRQIGRWERTWNRLTKLTLGYGYQPWRALLGLLLVVAVSVAVSWFAGRHGGLAHAATVSRPAQPCTGSELVGVGLDLGTPLLKTAARESCVPTTTGAGPWLTVGGWFLQVLAWAFAALFVAGFTGAVRKVQS